MAEVHNLIEGLITDAHSAIRNIGAVTERKGAQLSLQEARKRLGGALNAIRVITEEIIPALLKTPLVEFARSLNNKSQAPAGLMSANNVLSDLCRTLEANKPKILRMASDFRRTEAQIENFKAQVAKFLAITPELLRCQDHVQFAGPGLDEFCRLTKARR